MARKASSPQPGSTPHTLVNTCHAARHSARVMLRPSGWRFGVWTLGSCPGSTLPLAVWPWPTSLATLCLGLSHLLNGTRTAPPSWGYCAFTTAPAPRSPSIEVGSQLFHVTPGGLPSALRGGGGGGPWEARPKTRALWIGCQVGLVSVPDARGGGRPHLRSDSAVTPRGAGQERGG